MTQSHELPRFESITVKTVQRDESRESLRKMFDEDLTQAEQLAARFFEHHGFAIERVARSRGRVPDFEAQLDGERYIIEVKSRRDDEAIAELPAGVPYIRDDSSHWSMSVYANVKKAMRQFAERDPNHDAIWVVWLAAEARFSSDGGLEQIRGTLLGTVPLIDLDAITADGATAIDCYYAQRGAFEAFPQLDAAILVAETGFELWVNEFGNADHTSRSQLATLFAKNAGVNTVSVHVRAGHGVAVPGGRGSKTDAEVMTCLQREGGVRKPTLLRPRTHVGLMKVEPPSSAD